jgi:hypothetical protein
MDRNRFVGLSLVAFGCVFASFVVLGFGRLAVGYRTAQVFAAPFGLAAFALLVFLFGAALSQTVLGSDEPD